MQHRTYSHEPRHLCIGTAHHVSPAIQELKSTSTACHVTRTGITADFVVVINNMTLLVIAGTVSTTVTHHHASGAFISTHLPTVQQTFTLHPQK